MVSGYKTLESHFRNYNFEIRDLPDEILLDWCKKNYNEFYRNHASIVNVKSLLFIDFFVDYHNRRYSIFLSDEPEVYDSYKNSFVQSSLYSRLSSDFNFKSIFFYNNFKPSLDKVFSYILNNPNKSYYLFVKRN